MAVILTVRDIRELIAKHAGGPYGDSAPSTAMLGRLFHATFAQLVSDDSATGPRGMLLNEEPSLECWRVALTSYAFRHMIAPQFEQTRAQLHNCGEQAYSFWQATEQMCQWLAELWWEVYQKRKTLDVKDVSFVCEESLSVTLRDAHWADSVELRGVADALIRVGDRAWCVAELKLGRTSPEADLAQAALYHLMLGDAKQSTSKVGTLAVVSFKPRRDERLFSADELGNAVACLKRLIGQQAGVISSPKAADPVQLRASATVGFGMAKPEDTALGERLISALNQFGISGQLSSAPIVGPTFVRFMLKLKRGARFASVKNLKEDLALAMHVEAIPTVAFTAGEITVDVPRTTREILHFATIRPCLPKSNLLLGNNKMLVGVNLAGDCVFNDFSQPEGCHLLVAGTSGSGKSEWLRSALVSLMETNTPDTLRLVLIDPKRNAFHAWRDSPFLHVPLVFPDESPVIEILSALVEEMENRYRLFDGANDLTELVQRDRRPIPRILCVCDEYADLIAASNAMRKEVERLFGRLGAKARAAGIHLIMATQHPSRQIISGAIKSNLPGRIALRVDSSIESRLIETPDAERLLGKGDLLYKTIGNPQRVQSPLASNADLETCGRPASFALA